MTKKNIVLLGSIAFVVIGLIIFNIANRRNLSFSKVDDHINEGVKFAQKNQLENATTSFNRALAIDSLSYIAEYDKAVNYTMKGNIKLADSTYANAVRKYMVKKQQNEPDIVEHFPARAFHNKGNFNFMNTVSLDTIIMYNEMIEKSGFESLNLSKEEITKLQGSYMNTVRAIEDYKNALRDDPKRDDTRFNLAFAQEYEKQLRKILEQMPNNDQNQNQNQNDKNKQDQQNQQDQQDQQNKQDQQNNPEDERNKTDEKGGEKDDNIDLSKENADQILKAMEKDEENTLKKVRLHQKQQKGRRIEKNW